MRRSGRRPYKLLTEEERSQTLDAVPDLLAAAEVARWRDHYERWELSEIVYSRARDLGVALWPALAQRIVQAVP